MCVTIYERLNTLLLSPNNPINLLLIIKHQNNSAHHTKHRCAKGCDSITSSLSCSNRRNSSKDQHGKTLAQFECKGSCRIKHSFPVASGCDGITLGDICHNRLGQNSENRHRQRCHHRQDQSLYGFRNKAHFSHKSCIEISQTEYSKCK